MSLQWTLIAAFLYAEIAVILLLLMPFISPVVWQKFFKSKLLKSIGSYANLYFMVFIVILVLFFLDSLRQMSKYSTGVQHEVDHGHLDAELQMSMKMFRAQRNSYISGFSLFLALVIRRLVTLISSQANLKAQHEASLKQAKSASETAERLMKENEKKERGSGESADNDGNVKVEECVKTIDSLKKELKDKDIELERMKKDLISIKTQAENANVEYDRLSNEHDMMQKELQVALGKVGNKKEE